MKAYILAIALSLAVVTAASQQLLCKASEGSILYYLARDKIQPIDCVTNSTHFVLSKDQFDSIISRLEKLERELSLTKLASSTSIAQTIEVTRTISSTTTPPPRFEGWSESRNMYYKYFPSDKVKYLTAKARCKSHGGRLASTVLRDPNVIRDLAQAGFIRPYDFWLWIGFDDRVREGDWVWSDGGSMDPQTTAWLPGEPNTFRGANEDCGCVRDVSQGRILLNDAPCSFTFPYICEAEIHKA